MNLSRRQFLAGSLVAITAATATAKPSHPTYREFLLTTRDEEGFWSKGFGVTLSSVIAEGIATYEDCKSSCLAHGETLDGFSFSDMVIWEHRRVVALLQLQPDGSLKVTRFDGGKGAR